MPSRETDKGTNAPQCLAVTVDPAGGSHGFESQTQHAGVGSVLVGGP